MKAKRLVINITYRLIHFRKEAITIPLVACTLLLMIGFQQVVWGQQPENQSNFAPVLLNGYKLSGTFGELRSNHFHSGIDLKTGESTGLPVLAAAAGYVSRVKISANGYGKAIYITHGNNVTTVYAHLSDFSSPVLKDTILKSQKTKKSFETELFFDENFLQINEGQIIGWSGNTGSSEGPHLHFETRHTGSELPFDPVIKGYHWSDTIPPAIRSIAIYYPGPSGGIQGASRFEMVADSLAQQQTLPGTIAVYKDFFMGIEVDDKAGMEPNLLGIKNIRMYLNDSLFFRVDIDSFAFDQTRMINSFIDYTAFNNNKRRIILLHVLPGNELPFYESKSGIISPKAGEQYQIKFEATDCQGLTSTLMCILEKANDISLTRQLMGTRIPWQTGKRFIGSSFKVDVPPLSLMEDSWLQTGETVTDYLFYLSPVIELESTDPVAFRTNYTLSVHPSVTDSLLQPKLVLARIDTAGDLSYAGGKWENGWVVAKLKNTGNLVVVADTVAPVTGELEAAPATSYTGEQIFRLSIPVKPDFSGIERVNCEIDGNWVAAELYVNDPVIRIDYNVPSTGATHVLKVQLSDRCSNVSERQFSFTW